MPGKDSQPGKCNIRSVVYQDSCLLCKQQGTVSKYIGETERTLRERLKDYQDDAVSITSHSHMKEHFTNQHPHQLSDVICNFRMYVLKSCPSAIECQVREAVEIARGPPSKLL